MKARVKTTGEIIDVTFNKDALNKGYPSYKTSGGTYYYPEQLVWIDSIDSIEPDYWEKLKHQAAISAMQGLLSSSAYFEMHLGLNFYALVPSDAVRYATNLINELKEESQCEK